jgi:hypothetical protein
VQEFFTTINRKDLNNIPPLSLKVMDILRFFFLILILSLTAMVPAWGSHDPLRNMKEVAVFTTYEPHDAVFFGDYLYIADGNSLLIYNTSDPERPVRIMKYAEFNEPGRVFGLSVYGDRLYTASGPGWVYVLDIRDPERPEKMYQVNYLNSANSVAVADDYMYVADANTGLLIFSISSIRNPELVGMFYILKSNISGSLQGWGGIAVEVSGKYAFLSGAERKGFYIIDISNKTAPKEIFHSVGKNVYDIAVSDMGIFLARGDGTAHFDLLDVSNPYKPNLIGNFFIPGNIQRSAIAVHPSGDYIYAASGNTWHVYRMPDMTPPVTTIEYPAKGETVSEENITKEIQVIYRPSGLPQMPERPPETSPPTPRAGMDSSLAGFAILLILFLLSGWLVKK